MKKSIYIIGALILLIGITLVAGQYTTADECKMLGDYIDSQTWDVELVPDAGCDGVGLCCVDPVDDRQYLATYGLVKFIKSEQ